MTAVLAGPARRARVVLPPGRTLIEAVSAAMADLSWPSATLLLLGGAMARAVYHTSVLTPGGPRWIDYGPPREVAAPAWLVMGSATFGSGPDGTPAIHCHAVLAGADGVFGGHLSPDLCVMGPGIVAHATSAPNGSFRVMRDEDTGFDLLTPTLTGFGRA